VSDHHVPEKKTVMVCDDDPDLRLLFSIALNSIYNDSWWIVVKLHREIH
jgi:hypothetical protein